MTGQLKVAVMPQLESSLVRRLRGRTLRALLEERGNSGRVPCARAGTAPPMDRKIEELSGGELQRLAIARVLCQSDANVYMFDEVSSFLDVKQRLKAGQLIRSLVEEDPKRYVIVAEHDLAILDAVSDYVQCLYGTPGAYGVVTGRAPVRNGNNQFVAGYIAADNLRFRDHELTFRVSSTSTTDEGAVGKAIEHMAITNDDDKLNSKTGVLQYPKSSYTRDSKDGDTAKSNNKFTLLCQGRLATARRVCCVDGRKWV